MTLGKIVQHRKAPDYDVYIGAPSQWQNPYRDGDTQDESVNLDAYEAYLRRTPRLMALVDHLAGKTLACTCPAEKCHGNVLLKLAAEVKAIPCAFCAGDPDAQPCACTPTPSVFDTIERQVAPPRAIPLEQEKGFVFTQERLASFGDLLLPRTVVQAKPIIKAAGGKAKLLPQLASLLPSPQTFDTYVEPFLGGGAVFFHMASSVGAFATTLEHAHLGDANGDLIGCYQMVRDDVQGVITELDQLARDISPEAYYAARDLWNTSYAELSAAERAALFIYFNKVGFNGLWRVNASGKMNNPAGTLAKRAKSKPLYNDDNLRAVSAAFQKATLTSGPYTALFEQHAKPRAFFFLDPPYLGTYDGYTAEGFSETDHVLLAEACSWLDEQGAKFMLTHVDHPTIREIYKAFSFEEVTASRSGSGKAKGRGSVGEIVVRNYL